MSGAVERADVVVIGAGPAGLAATACLQRADLETITLERESEVGASWRHHYERLHLHTDRAHSELPYVRFPRGTPRYPSRLQVVSYLEDYARATGVEPRFEHEVMSARPIDNGWRVETQQGEFESSYLVVATGYNGRPNRPELEGMDAFTGPIVHSSHYKTGRDFAGQRVLVVGCGNSGAEIAIDLHESGAESSIVVRGPTHVLPRDLLGRPILATAILLSYLPTRVADAISQPLIRAVIGDLSEYGIVRPKMGPTEMIEQLGRVPILDIGLVDLIKRGDVTVVPAVVALEAEHVRFADGRRLLFDAIVLATGFVSNLRDFLEPVDEVCDERDYPNRHGEEAEVPGLFFIGFRNPPTGMLREISREARRIAKKIRRRHVRSAA